MKKERHPVYRLILAALTLVLILGVVMLVLSILEGQGIWVAPGARQI